MDVSVIIVNYNTRKLTQQCLDSLFFHTNGINYEVILVDNDSHDDSHAFFMNDQRIIFIQSEKNLGFGKANNLGFKYANGKYVFFLNSDTILLNNAVKLFYDFCESHLEYNIGVIGCVLLDRNQKETMSYVDFKSIPQYLKFSFSILVKKIFGLKNIFIKKLKNITVVDGVIGADMFMYSAIYKELNGFDPDFFLYGEEVELQKRISEKGYTQLIIRGPQIIHLRGASSDRKESLKYPTIYRLQEGNLLYAKKHFNVIEFYIYILLQFIIWVPWTLTDKRFLKSERKKLFSLLLNNCRYLAKSHHIKP